jgi:hypothetical protein
MEATMRIMRELVSYKVGVCFGVIYVGQILHASANHMDTRLDQVVLPVTVTSSADTGFNQPVVDTLLEDRAYPRPEPERPRATQRST